MKENLQLLCESFIANRDTVKSVFKTEHSAIYPICANIFTGRGQRAQADRLLSCRQIIKSQVGIFSNFRGVVQAPLACMLAVGTEPEEKMARTVAYYDLLKKSFWSSEYLALVALLLAEMTDRQTAEEKILRGKAIYQRMKKEHPFLTSSEDSVFAVLLAFSPKDDDALIADMEECYRLLKEKFSDSNCVQTVSHVLAMADGAPWEKTERLIRLYDSIQAAGGKYGRHHELAVLASLSLLPVDERTASEDLLAADDFLAQQKGYGFWGLDRRTRMMHAALIVSDEFAPAGQTEAAALTGTMTMIAAQQMAAVAAITAVTASSAAASSAHS